MSSFRGAQRARNLDVMKFDRDPRCAIAHLRSGPEPVIGRRQRRSVGTTPGRLLCMGLFSIFWEVPQKMPQTIHRGIKALIDEANAEIETVSAADAIKIAPNGDVVIVDIRDPREIEREGRIPGAFSCTRGMLEFWIDPASPYAKPIFQQDKKFIFHCAGGMRSALAGKTAQDMGLKPVAHMAGGFAAWRDAGGPGEKYEPKKPKG